jgi:hypothetical protein
MLVVVSVVGAWVGSLLDQLAAPDVVLIMFLVHT